MENEYIFKYWIQVKEGYKPVLETEKKNEIEIYIKAKNRATADRMIKALTGGNDNIIDIDGICWSGFGI